MINKTQCLPVLAPAVGLQVEVEVLAGLHAAIGCPQGVISLTTA